MLPPGASGTAAGSSVPASAAAENLLPPGATSSDSSSVDELLPPGAGTSGAAATTKGAAGTKKKDRPTVTIATADGDYVTLQEPVKKIGSRELKTLSTEEKAHRRLWTNVIVVGLCIVVLLGALAISYFTSG